MTNSQKDSETPTEKISEGEVIFKQFEELFNAWDEAGPEARKRFLEYLEGCTA